VSAKKRMLEQSKVQSERESLIIEMLDALNFVLTADGYIGFVAHETLNALEQIQRTARFGLSEKCATVVCRFVDSHLPSVCAVHNEKTIDHPSIRDWITVLQSLDCGFQGNVLQSRKWGLSLQESADPVLAEYGYVPVEVYAPPRTARGTPRSFLFARDSDGVEYHVSIRVADMSRDEFYGLRNGDRLLVQPEVDAETEKAIPVRDARFA